MIIKEKKAQSMFQIQTTPWRKYIMLRFKNNHETYKFYLYMKRLTKVSQKVFKLQRQKHTAKNSGVDARTEPPNQTA